MIGIVMLLLFCPHPHGWILSDATSRFGDAGGTYNFDNKTGLELSRLMDEGRPLAYQLDLLHSSVPSLVGFPAIAVLRLWTIDRRRKKKQSAI
jgi:hypothetical protein